MRNDPIFNYLIGSAQGDGLTFVVETLQLSWTKSGFKGLLTESAFKREKNCAPNIGLYRSIHRKLVELRGFKPTKARAIEPYTSIRVAMENSNLYLIQSAAASSSKKAFPQGFPQLCENPCPG